MLLSLDYQYDGYFSTWTQQDCHTSRYALELTFPVSGEAFQLRAISG